MKRIVFLTTEAKPYPGGIATYVHESARALAAQGYEVTLWVFGNYGEPPEPCDEYSTRLLTHGRFSVRRLPSMMAASCWRALRERADIWIAADFASITILGLLPVSGHKIGVLHGTEIRGRLFALFNRLKAYRPLQRLDRVVANSVFTRRLALQYHPYLDANRVVAAPLGVDATWFERVGYSAKAETCDTLMIPSGNDILVSVGRVERRKGLEFGIRAIQSLPAEMRRSITHLIIGRTVDEEYRKDLLAEIEAGDADIRLVGSVSDQQLHTIYEASSIMLHCSVPQPVSVEGFGLVLVEAAAKGLPIVAANTDAIDEVVQDGKTGLLVASADSDAMASAIIALLENRAHLEGMSPAAVEHARGFTWKRHVELMLN